MAKVSAADAVKAFKTQSITVQTSTPAKVKGADGKVRDGLKTEMKPLSEEHVLAANAVNGRVVMVTIDGRKYETGNKAPARETADA